MYRLVPALVRQMGAAYPELARAEPLIVETLQLEETRFNAMLDRGLHLLAEETARLGDGQPLPGAVAFRLYDTYGFPLDLTQDALREQGRAVDLAGFEAAMAEQRARARAAWAGSGEAATERVWFEMQGSASAPPNSSATPPRRPRARSSPWSSAARRSTDAPAGTEVAVILNQTPFYAESGGQVGDTGTITGARRICASPSPTPRRSSATCSCISAASRPAPPRSATPVVAEVDHARRTAIRAHHSATHLLHEALRRAARHACDAEGQPERARPAALRHQPADARSPATTSPMVEAEVNARIRENSRGHDAADDARRGGRTGAMALFGEKYGDEVRVVSMGAPRGQQARLVDRAVRRHACPRAPATSAISRSSPKARSPPACAGSRR